MTPQEIRAATAEERRFLDSRGVAPAFLARGFSTPSHEMWKPTRAEVIAARLATGFAPENAVGFSGASESSLQDVRRELSKLPVYAVLERTNPDVHAAVMRELEDGFRRGRSLEEIRATTFPKVLAVFQEALPRAPDASVRRFGELLVAQGRALERMDARHCAALLAGTISLATLNALPEELRKRDLEIQAEIIESARLSPQPTPSVEEVAPRFPAVLSAMPPRAREDMALLDEPDAASRKPGRYCDAALSFYEAILARPDAEAGPLLRALVGSGR